MNWPKVPKPNTPMRFLGGLEGLSGKALGEVGTIFIVHETNTPTEEMTIRFPRFSRPTSDPARGNEPSLQIFSNHEATTTKGTGEIHGILCCDPRCTLKKVVISCKCRSAFDTFRSSTLSSATAATTTAVNLEGSSRSHEVHIEKIAKTVLLRERQHTNNPVRCYHG